MKYSEICILYVLAVTKRLKQQKLFYEIFNATQSMHTIYEVFDSSTNTQNVH
jgi:hypothetical protein